MELTEKTLSSEIVFDGKIMTVRKDEIELPTGHKSSREVVEHSGGVVILAICQKDEEGKILMVKQFRYPEETGYEAAKWEYLGYIFTSPGYSNEKLYLYKATDLNFVGECPDEGEILVDYQFSASEVKKLINSGEISDAKTICAVMRGLC